MSTTIKPSQHYSGRVDLQHPHGAIVALTLDDLEDLVAVAQQHLADATPAPVPKTREEQAAFATAWDAKVDASRARHG